MKIEILCPDLCNLFGDRKNADYLQLCLPEAEFIQTDILEPEPYFVSHDVDMIYMGAVTENGQKRVTEWLMPHKERIESLIDVGTIFLMTGNAMEVFCREIRNKTTKESYKGLGIFEETAEIDLFDRYNGKNLGSFEGIEIVGFRSQFSLMQGDNSKEYFMEAKRGIGLNKNSKWEGLRRNHFMGTYMLGPLLVLNPLFTEYIMKLLGVEKPRAAFREQTMAAYEQRLSEFNDPKIPF